MARGGNRPGAGRKRGSPNKATAERQAEIAASGLTPLDYMLTIMRNEELEAATRLDAANKAAPYVHPKLAAIEHSGKLTFMTQDEALDELE
jgi:hypothetical protein